MAYDIKIDGLKEPVREEDHMLAYNLRKSWQAYKEGKINNSLVEIGGWSGLLGDIKYFNEVATRVKSDNVVLDSQKDFLEARRKFLAKTIEEKANSMEFFRFVYWGFTQKKSEDLMIKEKPIEEYVRSIQLRFFTENPNRTCCDPVLFKPLLKASKCHMAVLSIIEHQVQQDQYWSKRRIDGSFLPIENPVPKDYERIGDVVAVGTL